MSRLTRRTQILLDDERYEELERRSVQTGRSVASIIREAIDDKLSEDASARRRRAAGASFLAAPAPSRYDAEPDWEDVKSGLVDERFERAYADREREP